MARLPSVRSERLVRALQRAGFRIDRQRGSHAILVRDDGRFASVPMHAGRDVPRGLLARILADTGMTADELRDLL
ncbi:MAG: type II toxin-antitoxin system HicA family toxin [Vulcanimicrobiaceae bacterium]